MKKKYLLIGLAFIFALSIAACGNKGALKAPEPPTETAHAPTK